MITIEPGTKAAAFVQLFTENSWAGEQQDDISAHWQQKNPGMKLRAWRSPSQLHPAVDDSKRQYRIVRTIYITERSAVALPHLKLMLFPNHYFW